METEELAHAMEVAQNLDTEVLDHGLSYLTTPNAKVPISSISPIFWGGSRFPGALGIDIETRPCPRTDGRDGQDGNLSFGMIFVAWAMVLSGGQRTAWLCDESCAKKLGYRGSGPWSKLPKAPQG